MECPGLHRFHHFFQYARRCQHQTSHGNLCHHELDDRRIWHHGYPLGDCGSTHQSGNYSDWPHRDLPLQWWRWRHDGSTECQQSHGIDTQCLHPVRVSASTVGTPRLEVEARLIRMVKHTTSVPDLELYAQWAALPPTCYALTLSHSGDGTDPTAVPTHSTGCDEGKYLASEVIALTAHPTSGYQVARLGKHG